MSPIYSEDTVCDLGRPLARTLAAPLSTAASKMTHLTRRDYHCIYIWGREGRRDAGRAFGGEKIIAAIRQTYSRPTLDRRSHGRERPPRPILNTALDTHRMKRFCRHSPDMAWPQARQARPRQEPPRGRGVTKMGALGAPRAAFRKCRGSMFRE